MSLNLLTQEDLRRINEAEKVAQEIHPKLFLSGAALLKVAHKMQARKMRLVRI